MNLMRIWVLLCATALVVPGCKKKEAADDSKKPSQTKPTTGRPGGLSDAEAKKKAKALIDLLWQNKIDEAYPNFAPKTQKGLPKDRLAAIWAQTNKHLGKPKSVKAVKVQRLKQHTRVKVDLSYEKVIVSVFVVYRPDGKIVGYFTPKPKLKLPPWKPPEYAKKDTFTEQNVTVGSGPLALPGVLTLPKGDPKKTVIAVVLVHGSGPQDRDETLNATKPFKDLAWGLATHGIAVLRYDKVTKAHPGKVVKQWGEKFTLDNETVDDALKAVALLRKHKRIDPKKVFYLGHSQGAMAAPRAGKRDPKLAGLILMGGPSRPFEDLGISQFEYIAKAGGPQAEAVAKMLPQMRAAVKLVKSPKLTEKTPRGKLPLGIPAYFWLSLRKYKQVEVARKLKQPMLILQGEADYQVNMKDFVGWKKGLKRKRNVTFKSYPQLGHTFINLGKKMAVPMDYTKPGNVAKAVIEDIAKWIKAQK
jgi:fermentation-respiration switch protein FrsA (DUF1100 family)